MTTVVSGRLTPDEPSGCFFSVTFDSEPIAADRAAWRAGAAPGGEGQALTGGSGDVGSDDISRVAVKGRAGAVVAQTASSMLCTDYTVFDMFRPPGVPWTPSRSSHCAHGM